MRKLLLACVLAQGFASALGAAEPKTYQVTGPVLELTADTIVVQKGQQRWEIARDSSTPVTGDLQVGSKVTILYRMSAASIEVKPPKASKKAN